MTREETREKLIATVVAWDSTLKGKTIDDSMAFLGEGLNFDSLDLVEVIMKVEADFGISIPDSEAEKMKTFGDMVDYLHQQSP